MASRKAPLIKEIMKKYSKEELIKITNSKPRTSLKKIKEKLMKFKVSELEELLKEPVFKFSIKLNMKAVPIVTLSILIMISVLTQGFKFPQAQTQASVSQTNNKTETASMISAVITYLVDPSCGKCYDVTINSLILKNYGINLTEKYVNVNSTEGQSLISKYNITKYPTFVLSKEARSSASLVNVWLQVGTIENDGALVFRAPEIFEEQGNYKKILPNGTVEEIVYVPPETTLGNFIVTNESICTDENGSPIIYFFGSNSCPHCRWEHPVISEVISLFNDSIEFHDNMGANNDQDVFMKYININNGGVPFMVLGCKYIRVGSGEALALDSNTIASLNETFPNHPLLLETANLTQQAIEAANNGNTTGYQSLILEASKSVEHLVLKALICNLTNSSPAGVC